MELVGCCASACRNGPPRDHFDGRGPRRQFGHHVLATRASSRKGPTRPTFAFRSHVLGHLTGMDIAVPRMPGHRHGARGTTRRTAHPRRRSLLLLGTRAGRRSASIPHMSDRAPTLTPSATCRHRLKLTSVPPMPCRPTREEREYCHLDVGGGLDPNRYGSTRPEGWLRSGCCTGEEAERATCNRGVRPSERCPFSVVVRAAS